MPLKEKESSHWYTVKGEPAHQWEGKNTTLRTAKKLKREEGIVLLPSVTNLLNSLAKPALTRWMVEQGIEATAEELAGQGFLKGMPDDWAGFKQVTFERSRKRSMGAAGFGTAWHAMAETVALGRKPKVTDQLKDYLPHFQEWFDERVEEVERVEHILVDKDTGYAGTCDGIFKIKDDGWAIIDYKTSGKDIKKLRSWDEHCWQLASYRHAAQKLYPDREFKCMNVLVSSIEPGKPTESWWPEDKLEAGWEIFKRTAEIWQLMKGYKP